ncbi:MAG TPA: helix-turn-helix domain-containing protein [Phycisphaerae bacterium]|nr:helix-turn-helix domain-containing protein [Phycisphaerae bacterium]
MPSYLEQLTPKQVARAIGVSEASLKRWCNRGIIASVRTGGGHRRVPLSAVVQFLRESGRQLVRPEILGLPPATGNGRMVCCRALSQLGDALAACDDEQFQRVIFDLYLSRHTIADICDKVIAPAFRSVGEQWQHGALEVYQERRGVEICQRTLHRLYPMLPCVDDDAPRAFGGSLEGDPYVLPTTMAELVLKQAGWRAASYGACLPVTSLCGALRTVRPRLVWLSVSAAFEPEPFLAQYQRLYDVAHELGAALVVGGRWLTASVRSHMQFSSHCDTMNHLVAFARTLYSPPPSARAALCRELTT